MARKTEIVTIEPAEGNRDSGKVFLITEWPALRAERWALRATLMLAHSGVDIPDDALAGGMATLAVAGLKALNNLKFEEARPLLDEMWECVQVIPDPKNPGFRRPLMRSENDGDDIEELGTILLLREKVFYLHAAFFFKERS